MAAYLFDTSVAVAITRRDARVFSWADTLQPPQVFLICSIVRGELLYGLSCMPDGKKLAEVTEATRHFLQEVPCKPVPTAAGDIYATFRREQELAGLRLADNDLWIAATAMALGAILVTRDSDFSRIPSLQVITI